MSLNTGTSLVLFDKVQGYHVFFPLLYIKSHDTNKYTLNSQHQVYYFHIYVNICVLRQKNPVSAKELRVVHARDS